MPLIWAAIALAVIAVGVLVLLREPSDGLERYPHAFLAEAGYDPALLVVAYGPIEAPPAAPEGCLPAWRCNDPTFNDPQGRPWLFPMPSGPDRPVPPRHPGLRRAPALERCAIVRTPEAERMLETYRTRSQP